MLGNYLLINEACEKAIGKTSQEVIGKDDTFFFSASEAQMIMALDKKVIESGVSQTFEEIVTLADSNIHIFSTIKSPMFDDFGKPTGLFGIARDVTEQKQAEKTLLETQEQYRLLFNSSIDAIFITEPDGKIFSANPSACKIFGRTEEEICMLGRDGIVDTSDSRLAVALEERTHTGRFSGELTMIRKDGSKFQADVSSAVFMDKEGCEKTSMIIRDITERKKADEAIRQERILLRTLIDNLPDAIYVKDDKGRKLVANSVDMQIMNCASEAEIIGKTDLEIFDTEAGSSGYAEDMSVLQSGQPLLNHEDCFTDEEGVQHWRLTSKITLFNEHHKVIGLVGVGRDITERKKTEEQLLIAKEKAEESDRLKTAFLHNISHEVRTPMNAIIGFSGFLNEPDLTFEKRKHFTEIITQSSDQLLSIISDIMSIASIEAGQEKPNEKEFDLNLALKQLYEQFLLMAKKKNVSFNLAPCFTNNENWIISDGTKLFQVLTNLIGNALKFTKLGYVNFGYSIKGTEIEFFVEDTGIGIAPEMHQEIFKRFRQVETTGARNFGGSGLGLSISKAYVELLGGKVWLISELCKGSTFYFTISYKRATIKPILEKQSTNGLKIETNQSKTLLIAEDDDFNSMLFEELLSGLNVNIIRAINGLEAVEICKSNKHIDLILMDIKMPIMDGYEATKQIKEFNPTIPIIAQTAYSTEADKNKAIACGCNDFISKPLKKELLISKINEQINEQINK